jgi:Flp pilus assembly protein TadG
MMTRIRRCIKALAADSRGTSLVEFAAAAPVFALLVVGIGDISRGFSERLALQQAANRTIELAHLDTQDPTTDNYNYLVPEAATAAGVPQSQVSLVSWLECDGTRKAFDATCDEDEQIARYITLTINSHFRPAFSSIAYPGALPDGRVPIVAQASLRVQ